MAAKIKKGDKVFVIAGKDKGTTGEVVKVIPGLNRVVVSGVAVAKRHTKPNQQQTAGGIINKEMPIHVSNVALLDPKDNKPVRVGFKVVDGKKVRISRRSGEVID